MSTVNLLFEQQRRKLAELIHEDLREVEFSTDKSIVRLIDDITIMVCGYPERDDDDGDDAEVTHDVLVTIYNGLPPGPEVRDLPFALRSVDGSFGMPRIGRTDRRGQLRFRDVVPGTYRLMLAGGIAAHAGGSIGSSARVAAADDEVEKALEFHNSPGGGTAVRVRFPNGRFIAEVEVDEESLQGRRLARLVLTDRSGTLAALGWVGLYEELGREKFFGQLDLDLLKPGLRDRLSELSVQVDIVSPTDPGAGAGLDHEEVVKSLEDSIKSTDHDLSRKALVEALVFRPK